MMSVGLMPPSTRARISLLVAEPSLIQLSGGGGALGSIEKPAPTLATYSVPADRSFLVGDEDEVGAVGGVVAHQHGAVVGHDLHQLVRDAAQAVMLLDRARAVGVDRDLGQVAVVVGIGLAASPYRFRLKSFMKFLSRAANASGSYSSLDRWVPQGDRLAPQVIHRPLTPLVSTLWYLTRLSLPVSGFWSSVSTAIGDGSLPYMPVLPSWAKVVYSNCTTANTVLPLTPAILAPGTVSSGAVGSVGEEPALAADHGLVDDRLIVDVEIAASQDLAALDVVDQIARDEEGWYESWEVDLAVVVVVDAHHRADAGRRHRGCVVQGRAAIELKLTLVAVGCVIATRRRSAARCRQRRLTAAASGRSTAFSGCCDGEVSGRWFMLVLDVG